MIHFSQLEAITGGKNVAFHEDHPVTSLLIDSRKATVQETTPLFFAIKGERHDGHRYIKELYERGVRQFVVETVPDQLKALPYCNMIRVTSSLDALQKLAAHHRKHFSIPVIGITGSNGKTIIKEWLYQMLSKDRIIVKNPGSYNSQVGVPLSVWQMQPQHQLGIFEAGISKPGEMSRLASVIQPTIGLFTNIGSAHNLGFTGEEQKIDEKLKLFEHVETLVYCNDHVAVDRAAQRLGTKTFTWGSARADVIVEGSNGHYSVVYKGNQARLDLPFTDGASVENVFHCVALMLRLGYSFTQIQEGITGLQAIPMRLELKEGVNQSYVIDDTYNNDLGGLEISLQFLTHQHQKKKKSLILSDILESGLKNEELVRRIADLVLKNKIQRFIGVGPVLGSQRHLFPPGSLFYETTRDFIDHFDADLLQQEIILVKGARSFQFEKIVARLQRKVHGTVMEIDLGALIHNFNYFKSCLKPSTKVMVMVKAFAYGSGSAEIANILQYHQADYLGVAYTDEGVELRKNNIALPVMVMNPSEESFDQIIHYNLEPEIYSFKIFQALLNYLEGKPCKIHLKLDTGMHRLGFEQSDLKELEILLRDNPQVKVASVFSHLAGADESGHDEFSRDQAKKLIDWADRITTVLGYKPLYHVLNSPGILRLPDLQMDMVRLGIGLYGVDPTSEGFGELRPVASLKTVISQIKRIGKGETIGYGRRGVAEKDMTLGTIAIGYADGFNRAFSRGVGQVMINGVRAKVIGNVCMDMTMVNLSGIDASEGDEVIIFGKGLPIQEVASMINTIPYEILTNTSERVKRVFIAEGI